MKIVFTDEADADLLHIIEYLAARHRSAARDLAMLLDARLKTLAQFPLVGRDRSTLVSGIRSIAAHNYVVFYRIEDDAVVIARILDGRRDVDEEFIH